MVNSIYGIPGKTPEIKERLNMIFGKSKNGLWLVETEIKNVIFNDPATIVFWSDGTKTVVKAHNEEFDPEKGLAMAICKKVLGNKGNFNNLFKKWVPEEKKIMADDVIDAFNKIMNEPIAETTEIKFDSKGLTIKAQRNNKVNWWTVKGLAVKEGVSEKVIRKRIADGVYPGAFKQSGAWLIPIKRTDEK